MISSESLSEMQTGFLSKKEIIMTSKQQEDLEQQQERDRKLRQQERLNLEQ